MHVRMASGISAFCGIHEYKRLQVTTSGSELLLCHRVNCSLLPWATNRSNFSNNRVIYFCKLSKKISNNHKSCNFIWTFDKYTYVLSRVRDMQKSRIIFWHNTLFRICYWQKKCYIFFTASIRSGNNLLFNILTWLQQRKQKFFCSGWSYM